MDQQGRSGKLIKPAFELKHHTQRRQGWCHTFKCKAESEVVLESKAAEPYRVGRLELCDEHWEIHCEVNDEG